MRSFNIQNFLTQSASNMVSISNQFIHPQCMQRHFPLSRICQVDNLAHPLVCVCSPRSQLRSSAKLTGKLEG